MTFLNLRYMVYGMDQRLWLLSLEVFFFLMTIGCDVEQPMS